MKDERKGSSASVFEVANANGPNDLTRGKCEFLSAAICRLKKKRNTLFFFFFYWTDPFTFVQNDTIRHLINCWGSILKFLMISSRSE